MDKSYRDSETQRLILWSKREAGVRDIKKIKQGRVKYMPCRDKKKEYPGKGKDQRKKVLLQEVQKQERRWKLGEYMYFNLKFSEKYYAGIM